MLLPAIHPAADRDTALNRAEGGDQASQAANGAGQLQGVLLNGLRGFHETAVGGSPATDEADPMLDEHGQQLGVELTQDAPGFRAPRLIHTPVALPSFTQQFDLPADPR